VRELRYAKMAFTASIMLTRENKKNASRLNVVCRDATGFAGLPVHEDKVTPQLKSKYLQKKFDGVAIKSVGNQLDKEEYSQLEARLAYRKRMKDQEGLDDDHAWQGLKDLPGGVKLPPFDSAKAEEITIQFNQERRAEINHVLKDSPYVYLAGITGVGKSTFIEQDFSVDQNGTLYKGESAMETWATDTSPGIKYLFIDEANVTSRQSQSGLNDEQKHGGLGGIVVEGEAGIGKSELVTALLLDRGYKRVENHDKTVSDKLFYVMPVSMPTDQKKELLLKAFHQGAKRSVNDARIN